MMYGSSQRERCFHMVDCTSPQVSWICSPQGAFCNVLCLWYSWTPSYLPSHSTCGAAFTVEHLLQCKCGGFPSMQHNEIRDITAHRLTERCHDVMTELPLQELSGETMSYRSANTEDNARVDIVVHGFWSPFQWTFLDARVLSPFASTYTYVPVCSAHR